MNLCSVTDTLQNFIEFLISVIFGCSYEVILGEKRDNLVV